LLELRVFGKLARMRRARAERREGVLEPMQPGRQRFRRWWRRSRAGQGRGRLPLAFAGLPRELKSHECGNNGDRDDVFQGRLPGTALSLATVRTACIGWLVA